MNETKRLEVQFSDSMPMGTHATFKHDGEMWICYPAKKSSLIWSVIDRLVGVHASIAKEMVRWINERPGDADLIARVLERTERARTLHSELMVEKREAGME
jgi:hypothetical protein